MTKRMRLSPRVVHAVRRILLGAHALWLGSCLIGYAVSAVQKNGWIQEALNIPRVEPVHAGIALGRPAVAYRRPAG